MEAQIKAFKTKKLLLRELEDQMSSLPPHTPMTNLLASKIQALKHELEEL